MQLNQITNIGVTGARILIVVLMLVGLGAVGLAARPSTAHAQAVSQPDGKSIAYLPLVSSGNVREEIDKRPQPTPTPQPASGTAVPPSPTGTPAPDTSPDTSPTPGSSSIYWGAYIDGKQYNQDNPPWDMNALDTFEAHAGKKISILHFGLPWSSPAPCWPGSSGGSSYYPFQPSLMTTLRSRGIIPMIDWASWSRCGGTNYDTASYTLSAITNGAHDDYIRQWAGDAKAWGHPFFLRLNWEMNGDWFPWSEEAPGNSAGQFVKMWRHVHHIFESVGADNVSWVWCPNAVYPESTPMEQFYPGHSYVDWTCFDGYNKPPAENDTGKWKSFYQVAKETYDRLLSIAPDKPIMIGETSSTETGGSKAEWIKDALTTHLPVSFPRIKALVWFNWNCDNYDWVIETSSASQSAFAKGIASPYYAASDFSALNTSPIPPP